MAARAEEDLQRAQSTNDYTDYAKAVFAFEEAVSLWSGNVSAKAGVQRARFAYAQNAFRKGDYDLAASQLSDRHADQAELLRQVNAASEERNARKRRLLLARRAMLGLVALIFTISTVAFFWIRSERNEAVFQRGLAEAKSVELQKQTEIAVKQTEIAKTNAAEALKQQTIAETNAEEALRQKGIAEVKTQEAIENEMKAIANEKLALANEQKAITSEMLARANEQEALRQKSLAEYEAYVSGIGLAAAKIEENAFDVAEQLLQASDPDLRNWEWGRLQHLCQQSKLAIHATATVDAIAMSPTVDQFVMATWDRRAVIVDLNSGEQLRELVTGGKYVHAADWSPNGSIIATGGSDPAGFIRLWDAQTGESLVTVTGHDDTVISVRFSPDGRWLLTTSYDSTARLWQVTGTVDAPELIPALTLMGHSWWVWGGAFAPGFNPLEPEQHSRLVTVSQDGKAIAWEISIVGPDDRDDTVAVSAGPSTSHQQLQAKQIAVFTGHGSAIYSVDISPETGAVATGGYDGRVLVWNIDEVPIVTLDDLLSRRQPDMPLRSLVGHGAPVQTVRFSGNGSRLVSGGRDNAVLVWNMTTSEREHQFRGHSRAVRSACFSNDGLQVVSGGHDAQALVWDTRTYAESRDLKNTVLHEHRDAVLGARFSPDGKQIVTAGRDRIAMTWDAATGERLQTFREGHEYLAMSGKMLPGGKTLVTAAADNSVRLWNVEEGTQKLTLPVATGRSALLALSSEATWLYTGALVPSGEGNSLSDGAQAWRLAELAAWDGAVESAPHSISLTGHNGPVTAVAASPTNDHLVATGDANGRCILRDMHTGEVLWSVRHHTGRITGIRFTRDGQQLLTASQDHTVGRLDVADGNERGVLKVGAGVQVLELSRDGVTALTVSTLPDAPTPHASRIHWWDLNTGDARRTIDLTEFSVASIGTTSDPNLAVICCSDNSVRLLRLTNDEQPVGGTLLDFQQLGGVVQSASFVNDDAQLLTVGGNEARLWEASSRRLIKSYSPHGAIAAATFSPDGSKIATGSWDHAIKVWDATTAEPLMKLEGQHTGYINSVVYSPDGTLLLSASDDRTAILWDAQSGAVVRVLQGHRDRVRAAV
ncbi:MAG: hypothetical protein KDA58_06625, partial [Planctomycetaceae bacterium]|nr:hypothetical protein [Planctomycetaceae bacterium]